MSGHFRVCFAAFVLLASLSTSLASSNPFADLFNVAPKTAPAPASAEGECLPRAGKSTTDGQHWVYRLDGHRKCWFQAAEGIATVKKRVRHHVAKHGVAAPVENENAQRRREAVVDAHAEVLRSAPPETSQPTPLASELKVVDAASVVAMRAAAPAPQALDANRATDQLMPAIAEASDDGWGWTANWLGMLLMALGLVSVLSSSRFLRGAMLLRS